MNDWHALNPKREIDREREREASKLTILCPELEQYGLLPCQYQHIIIHQPCLFLRLVEQKSLGTGLVKIPLSVGNVPKHL